MAHKKEPDEVTIVEAAKMVNRSQSAIRVWLRKGILKGRQASHTSNSPVLIARTELVRAMDELGIKVGETSKVPIVNEQAEAYTLLLRQKDTIIEQLSREIDRLHKLLAEKDTRLDVLQRELRGLNSHGRGVWGWLSDRLSQ
jgi:hypothetical protein